MNLSIEDITEGNKLIAEFEGATILTGITEKTKDILYAVFPEDVYNGMQIRVDLLRYYSEWNHIMPVVEKISNEQGAFRIVVGNVRTYSKIDGTTFSIRANASTSPIESIWKAVVEFIKWYNENKSHEK